MKITPEVRARLEETKRRREEEQRRAMATSDAWRSWLESDEGQSCADDRHAVGEYLRNRLWRAFMAGAAAAEQISRHSGSKES